MQRSVREHECDARRDVARGSRIDPSRRAVWTSHTELRGRWLELHEAEEEEEEERGEEPRRREARRGVADRLSPESQTRRGVG